MAIHLNFNKALKADVPIFYLFSLYYRSVVLGAVKRQTEAIYGIRDEINIPYILFVKHVFKENIKIIEINIFSTIFI